MWTPWTGCPSCGLGNQMRLKLCSWDHGLDSLCIHALQYEPLSIEVSECSLGSGISCIILVSVYGIQWRECNIPLCPSDGFWSEWTPWSSCTTTCSGGYQRRDRICLGLQNGGQDCEGSDHGLRACSEGSCSTSRWMELPMFCITNVVYFLQLRSKVKQPL